MELARFVAALYENAAVEIDAADLRRQPAIQGAESALREVYRQDCLRVPGRPPAFNPEAALWSADLFYHACAFLVLRETEAGDIRSALTNNAVEPRSCEIIYSVDLCFRFLPDLFHLACNVAEDDPLVENLRQLAGKWPLSSVGIDLEQAPSISTFADNACLMGLYADRVVARQDRPRLENAVLRDYLDRNAGLYPELYGPFYQQQTSDCSNENNR